MANKNDDAWEKLFAKHDILGHVSREGFFEITATQVNEFRESRLMTKFDHRSNLPKLFTDNKLAILPITRGSYIIGCFEAYSDINYDETIKTSYIHPSKKFSSLDHDNLYSESAAINCAYAYGILNDLAGEELVPTLSGRMSTGSFDFIIDNVNGLPMPIKVNNSQCEIDGGFEGAKSLILLEAKKEQVSDFLVRQLYYPYRLWQSRISSKIVKPIFFTHSNDVFSFFVYEFTDPSRYNSLRLVEQRNFIIAPESISLDDIKNILNEAVVLREPDEPFPQADDFRKIVDLLGILMAENGQTLANEEITSRYDFDKRQSNYYGAAAAYLGLVDRKPGYISLSPQAMQILQLPYRGKYLALARLILQHGTFHKALAHYFKSGALPIPQIVEFMKSSGVKNVNSEETYQRRAQSVLKWVNWILELSLKK